MHARLTGGVQRDRGGIVYNFQFVSEADEVINPNAAINLSGYEIAETGDELVPSDTILQAFAKLEARILELENAAEPE